MHQQDCTKISVKTLTPRPGRMTGMNHQTAVAERKSGSEVQALDPSTARSLAEQAHDALEELIVTMKLAPGSVWNELSLAEMITIGRTPAREAIKRLETEHLISIVPRHGVMISKIDLYEQMQVVELRTPLERLISRWAAVRCTSQERTQVLEMAEAFASPARKQDALAYLRSVFSANTFIAQCARNPFAAESIARLHTLSRRFFYCYHDPAKLGDFSDLHGERARAIASGNPEEAGLASDNLMKEVDAFTRSVVERTFGPA